MNLTATVHNSNVKKALLLTALLGACSEAPTTVRPVVQQGTPAVQNNYRPTLDINAAYNQPTISSLLKAEDKDAKGIGAVCIYTKPDGTKQTIERISTSAVQDTLLFSDEPADVERTHRFDCKAYSQGDTVTKAATVTIAAKPKAPTPTVTPTSILNPTALGYNNKTLDENFTTLTDVLFAPEKHFTEIKTFNGKPHLLVPWYSTSSNTNESSLHTYSIGTATRERYVMVTDELREVALLVAMGKDNARMQALKNTIETLIGTTGLPGWVSEVTSSGIRLISNDPASDGTAGLGLALYVGAKNAAFPQADRLAYQQLADRLARTSIEKEYIKTNLTDFTGAPMTRVLAGGAGTASAGLGNAEMWTGYYEVAVPFLQAAYASTGDNTFRDLARSVTAQFLMTSGYDAANPTKASVGRKQFKLAQSNGKLTAIAISSEVYDDSDAPRALWMGNTLRVAKLAGEDIAQGVYKHLDNWVQALISTGTQTSTSSCLQYTLLDASRATNCGGGQYQNGLGGGLILYAKPEWVKPKLDEAMKSVNWSNATYWSGDQGVFRNRLPKLLGVALGKDALAYVR